MDCGDNSCLFAEAKGGMRTNGGRRCLEPLRGVGYRKMATHVRAWLAAAKAQGIREGMGQAAILVHEESIRADRDEGHPGAALRRALAAIRAAAKELP